MTQIKIPGASGWNQPNRGDLRGNLWSTMGIDFQTNPGAMRLFPRMQINTSTSDFSTLGCPVAFKAFDTLNWAICGTHVFHNAGDPSGAWTDDASTGFQTTFSPDTADMEIFNGTLCAATQTGLYSKAADGAGGGAWTSRDTLTTGTNHVMTYFKKYERLYYGINTASITSISTGWATADAGSDYGLALAPANTPDRVIACMKASTQFIWIGMINKQQFYGGRGFLSKWDGISSQVTSEYVINALGVLAIAIDPATDTPVIMDSNGVLSSFSGNGPVELGRLPFPKNSIPTGIADAINDRFIHPNGMHFTRNGTIRMLINNLAPSGNVNENCPSGIWEWSKETGLVHLAPLTYNPMGTTTITDFGQNQVSRVGALVSTVNSARNLFAGATIFTDGSNTKSAIFISDPSDIVRKAGYFVTTKIPANFVRDHWQKLYLRFRKFLDSTDKIVLKYRLSESAPVYFSISAWPNTTSFTTTASQIVGKEGQEVEVLQGAGSGFCAHIISITGPSGGQYTVTLDETITGATSTGNARVQNWIKMPAITNQTLDFAKKSIDSPSAWVQIKCFMLFTGEDEVNELALTSKTPAQDVQLAS